MLDLKKKGLAGVFNSLPHTFRTFLVAGLVVLASVIITYTTSDLPSPKLSLNTSAASEQGGFRLTIWEEYKCEEGLIKTVVRKGDQVTIYCDEPTDWSWVEDLGLNEPTPHDPIDINDNNQSGGGGSPLATMTPSVKATTEKLKNDPTCRQALSGPGGDALTILENVVNNGRLHYMGHRGDTLAIAGNDRIWLSDRFYSLSPTYQMYVMLHEVGHLTAGEQWVVGLPDGSFVRTSSYVKVNELQALHRGRVTVYNPNDLSFNRHYTGNYTKTGSHLYQLRMGDGDGSQAAYHKEIDAKCGFTWSEEELGTYYSETMSNLPELATYEELQTELGTEQEEGKMEEWFDFLFE